MLTAYVVALVLAPAADIPVITPEEALAHADQEVVVQGQVRQVGSSKDGKTLFLNFGGLYPKQVFTAVIFERSLTSFPEARAWEGRSIKVRGKIELYEGRGMPEIILERQEQVTIDSSTARAQAGVAETTDYDTPPRPTKITRPQYPQEAFVRNIEGAVVVEILIDTQGRVVRARVLRSVPLLDAAALQCVYQWTFDPALRDGRPVPSTVQTPVIFRKHGQPRLEQREQRPVIPPAAPAPSGESSHAPQGTGQSIGGLYLDPQGADFTLWVQRFKDDVYRNWIIPQEAYSNLRGQVAFEFTVEKDGSVSALRMDKSSGTLAYDRAAQFALTKSKFSPLPDDYGPPRITMKVTFFYQESPPH